MTRKRKPVGLSALGNVAQVLYQRCEEMGLPLSDWARQSVDAYQRKAIEVDSRPWDARQKQAFLQGCQDELVDQMRTWLSAFGQCPTISSSRDQFAALFLAAWCQAGHLSPHWVGSDHATDSVRLAVGAAVDLAELLLDQLAATARDNRQGLPFDPDPKPPVSVAGDDGVDLAAELPADDGRARP